MKKLSILALLLLCLGFIGCNSDKEYSNSNSYNKTGTEADIDAMSNEEISEYPDTPNELAKAFLDALAEENDEKLMEYSDDNIEAVQKFYNQYFGTIENVKNSKIDEITEGEGLEKGFFLVYYLVPDRDNPENYTTILPMVIEKRQGKFIIGNFPVTFKAE